MDDEDESLSEYHDAEENLVLGGNRGNQGDSSPNTEGSSPNSSIAITFQHNMN